MLSEDSESATDKDWNSSLALVLAVNNYDV